MIPLNYRIIYRGANLVDQFVISPRNLFSSFTIPKRGEYMNQDIENIELQIECCIYLIRGCKVMLDHDLARLYQVTTKSLVQAVKRNLSRFPDDFMFQLSPEEYEDLRSQIVTSSGRIGRRYSPHAFTEQGIAMLSGVLRSERAIKVNVEIMRAFVRLRKILLEHHELKMQLENLEKRYDKQFRIVFDAIRELMNSKSPPKMRQIGFKTSER